MGKPFEIIDQTSLFILCASRLAVSFLFLVDFIRRLAQVGRRKEHGVDIHLLGHCSLCWLVLALWFLLRLGLGVGLLLRVLELVDGTEQGDDFSLLALGDRLRAALQEVQRLARLLRDVRHILQLLLPVLGDLDR